MTSIKPKKWWAWQIWKKISKNNEDNIVDGIKLKQDDLEKDVKSEHS